MELAGKVLPLGLVAVSVLGLFYSFRQRIAGLPIDIMLLGGGLLLSLLLFILLAYICSSLLEVKRAEEVVAVKPDEQPMNLSNQWAEVRETLELAELKRKALEEYKAQIVEQQTIELSLGDFKDVHGRYSHMELRLELVDMPNADAAIISIYGVGIVYTGRNVQRLGEDLGKGAKRLSFPRISLADLDDSAFYVNVHPTSFYFWRVCVDHINTHAKKATVVVSFVTSHPVEQPPSNS